MGQLSTAQQELLCLHSSLCTTLAFLYSASADLQKWPFGDVPAPFLWLLSFRSHPWDTSALIQHHRPHLHDARADRCHHLSVCYHNTPSIVTHRLNPRWKALDEIYAIHPMDSGKKRETARKLSHLNFVKMFPTILLTFDEILVALL